MEQRARGGRTGLVLSLVGLALVAALSWSWLARGGIRHAAPLTIVPTAVAVVPRQPAPLATPAPVARRMAGPRVARGPLVAPQGPPGPLVAPGAPPVPWLAPEAPPTPLVAPGGPPSPQPTPTVPPPTVPVPTVLVPTAVVARNVPVPTAPPLPASVAGVPVRLRIPWLGVNTRIESVGLRDGAMDVPSDVWDVAWFNLGPRPGEAGNAVIDGHLDSAVGPAVFLYLRNLRVGDRIYVTDNAGVVRTFAVTEMDSYGLNDAPLERIFGASSGRHLNLITCSGTWDAQAHIYNQRLVVYTQQVAA